jgi:hypothetical protein
MLRFTCASLKRSAYQVKGPHALAQQRGREFARRSRPVIPAQHSQCDATPTPSSMSSSSLLVVGLGSAVAYRARLHEGNYVTLSELCAVPFAPSKCHVVTDVMRLMLDGHPTPQSPMTVPDVRRVLGTVAADVGNAVRLLEQFSDSSAHAAASSALAQVETLQRFIDDHWFDAASGSVEPWVLSHLGPEVAAEILLQLQQCQSASGQWRECVLNYSRMKSSFPFNDRVDVQGMCLLALHACEKEHAFEAAHSLFQAYVADCGVTDVPRLSDFVTALAKCISNAADLGIVRALFIDEGAAAIVPVSVELYTALISGCARAVTEPKRMTIALSLYRAIKDAALEPTAQTYSELIAVTASCGEPTHAFAFFTEARTLCGVAALPPSLYTHLLQSYVTARYFHDASLTLSVLIEAGAPLNRAAFHTVLSGATNTRDAAAVVALMTGPKFNIKPTFSTYGLLLVAESRRCRGVETLLHAYDLWSNVAVLAGEAGAQGVDDVPRWLAQREPALVESLEQCLLVTRLVVGDAVQKYVAPLVRSPQLVTTEFLGGFAPQGPTKVPPGSLVAVLAADVLRGLDLLFEPIAHHFSAVVVPYSQIALLRRAGTRGNKGNGTLREEQQAVTRLKDFLQKHAARVHLMSLEEELRISADFERCGVGARNVAARPAAIAMALARGLDSTISVYASSRASFYVLTTKFNRCGRFVVDNPQCRGHVKLLNPLTHPDWAPVRASVEEEETQVQAGEEEIAKRSSSSSAAINAAAAQEPSIVTCNADGDDGDEVSPELLMQLLGE